MKKSTKTIFALSIISLISCSNNHDEKKTLTNNKINNSYNKNRNYCLKNLSGDWEPDCKTLDGYIEIPKSFDTAKMQITLNQIDIASKIEIDSNDSKMVLEFKLTKPTDLGAGGGSLHWDNFSRDSVIIKMNIIDSTRAKLTWYGFYDNNLKRRFWKDGFDMLGNDSTKNEVLVYKCSEPTFK